MSPICYDLCCGLGGWTEGFLSEGYRCIGYDIEAHEYGDAKYPGELRLKSILDLHGSELADAACIVASPPCQEFSYMAMPWKRGKQIAAALRGERGFPCGYDGSQAITELTALFDACFRIQREASAAAGRHIPMVVENVKGAQPWVGQAKANFGSFYLWGDIETVNGNIVCGGVQFGSGILRPPVKPALKFNPDGTEHPQGSWFKIADSKNRGVKNPGQDWNNFKNGKPVAAWNDSAVAMLRARDPGQKTSAHINKRDGHTHTRHLTAQFESDRVRGLDAQAHYPEEWGPSDNRKLTCVCGNALPCNGASGGIKQAGLSGEAWFDHGSASHGSASPARKAASALIAKIPYALANYIAKIYNPMLKFSYEAIRDSAGPEIRTVSCCSRDGAGSGESQET